jgi:hypothetical protein
MEEAALAEDGILDPHFVANQVVEDAGSCADQEYHCQDQVISIFSTVLRRMMTDADAENLLV